MDITGLELHEYEAERNDESGHHRSVHLTLGEVCIEGGPKGLRKLARFLKDCARHMAKGGEQDHFHYNGNVNTRPQIIVINKRIADQRRAEDAYDVAADPERPLRTELWHLRKALSRLPAPQRKAALDEAVRRRTPERTKAKRLREEVIRSIVSNLDIAETDGRIDIEALIDRAAAELR